MSSTTNVVQTSAILFGYDVNDLHSMPPHHSLFKKLSFNVIDLTIFAKRLSLSKDPSTVGV